MRIVAYLLSQLGMTHPFDGGFFIDSLNAEFVRVALSVPVPMAENVVIAARRQRMA
jgi:hypothetical protein